MATKWRPWHSPPHLVASFELACSVIPIASVGGITIVGYSLRSSNLHTAADTPGEGPSVDLSFDANYTKMLRSLLITERQGTTYS